MSAIVNSNNVIFANGGGASNDNLKFSNVVGGIDDSPASADISLQRTQAYTTYYRMNVTNESGNTASFTLIPTDTTSGFLYIGGDGSITTKVVNSSPIWCHAFTTSSPSVTTTKSTDYKEVHLSTPYDYDGPANYTAVIDGQNFVMGSGTYTNMVWQNVEGTEKWCITDSGNYRI